MVTILTTPSFHDEVFQAMLRHHAIDHMRLAGKTIFMIKEMRVEIIKIDGYV